jgi:hypothetical protein
MLWKPVVQGLGADEAALKAADHAFSTSNSPANILVVRKQKDDDRTTQDIVIHEGNLLYTEPRGSTYDALQGKSAAIAEGEAEQQPHNFNEVEDEGDERSQKEQQGHTGKTLHGLGKQGHEKDVSVFKHTVQVAWRKSIEVISEQWAKERSRVIEQRREV